MSLNIQVKETTTPNAKAIAAAAFQRAKQQIKRQRTIKKAIETQTNTQPDYWHNVIFHNSVDECITPYNPLSELEDLIASKTPPEHELNVPTMNFHSHLLKCSCPILSDINNATAQTDTIQAGSNNDSSININQDDKHDKTLNKDSRVSNNNSLRATINQGPKALSQFSENNKNLTLKMNNHSSLTPSKSTIKQPHKKHECLICLKIFSTNSLLLRHKQSHYGPSDRFKCDACNRCFTQKATLKRHKQHHCYNKSSWKCSCGRTYSRRDN